MFSRPVWSFAPAQIQAQGWYYLAYSSSPPLAGLTGFGRAATWRTDRVCAVTALARGVSAGFVSAAGARPSAGVCRPCDGFASGEDGDFGRGPRLSFGPGRPVGPFTGPFGGPLCACALVNRRPSALVAPRCVITSSRAPKLCTTPFCKIITLSTSAKLCGRWVIMTTGEPAAFIARIAAANASSPEASKFEFGSSKTTMTGSP